VNLVTARERYSLQAKFTTYLYRIARNPLVEAAILRSANDVELTLELLEDALAWLEYIAVLNAEGRIDEACTQLKAFRSHYPEHELPVALGKLEKGLQPKP
tara:strand:+ start:49 stop:351 length:303 start_codon:yes stop_codon:yes gene_type:complete